MSSPRYLTLLKRVDALQRNLLPKKLDPGGFYRYKNRVADRTRAYSILVHAELESYIEDRAVEVLDKAHLQWINNGTVRASLLALMTYGVTSNDPPSRMGGTQQKANRTFEEVIRRERRCYEDYVRKDNHGIKAKNLLRILIPIGVTENEIDTRWVYEVDAWATSRGLFAHSSGSKVQYQPDPYDQVKKVERILKGFGTIDQILESK